jgi:hypothetical protein
MNIKALQLLLLADAILVVQSHHRLHYTEGAMGMLTTPVLLVLDRPCIK